MTRQKGTFALAALGLAILMAGCWGSSKSTSLEVGVAPQPARVGFQQCITTCHAVTPDHITGLRIAATWENSVHYVDKRVECEDCHGNGGNHWGVGPIPEPNPVATCAACHGFPGFTATRHYDQQGMPGALFFQADAGTGQADLFGVPVLRADNVTPVTRAQHIEECSRCHNPSQEFLYARDGSLDKPDPAAMPAPHVACGGCHDGHNPAAFNDNVPQRGLGTHVYYARFRNYLVDNVTGAQTDNVAAQVGLATLNLLFQPNGAVLGTATPNYGRVVGNNNEIHPERVCAACHAKGKYKYTVFNANGQDVSTTHQPDVYTQWTLSSHGDRFAAAFGEFSAKPSFYGFEEPGSHMATYPWDMKLSRAGTTATASQNGSYIPTGSSSAANGFACYKCHHGIGSIAHQDNVQGQASAPVLFGDVPVTCVTCHNPHTDVAGQSSNTRKPVSFTEYSGKRAIDNAAYAISGNVFVDNTAVPSATGNATICAFCHQGRESGLTLYLNKDFGRGGTGSGSSFQNPHYLGTAAMLWARNGYEHPGRTYGVNAAHQRANCTNCHMANATTPAGNGGHTWIPNFASCNKPFTDGAGGVTQCHNTGGALPAVDNDGTASPNPDIYRAAADINNYTGDTGGQSLSVSDSIQVLANKVMLLLATQGLYYNDTAYPYCFKVQNPAAQNTDSNPALDNSFKSWTPPIYKAAFNLQFVIKGLPSVGSSPSTVTIPNPGGNTAWDVIVPVTSNARPPSAGGSNPSAATHNHEYTIQLLQDSYKDLYDNVAPAAKVGFVDPALMVRPSNGTQRPATVYGPNQ